MSESSFKHFITLSLSISKSTQANANIFGFLGTDAAKLLQKQCPIGVYIRKTDAGVYWDIM
jgi:hypothetical protein